MAGPVSLGVMVDQSQLLVLELRLLRSSWLGTRAAWGSQTHIVQFMGHIRTPSCHSETYCHLLSHIDFEKQSQVTTLWGNVPTQEMLEECCCEA